MHVRNYSLDSLRGLAALLVALYHWGRILSPEFDALPFVFGDTATTMFFLLSGAVIPPAIERAGLRRFWARRFWRLFPLYWLCMGIMALQRQPDPLIVVANLTMAPRWFGMPLILDVGWTLAYELAFYLLASLLYVLKTPIIPFALLLCGAAAIDFSLLPIAMIYAGAARRPVVYLALVGAVLAHGDPWARLAGLALFLLPLPSPPPLRWLGDISYGIYLWHLVVVAILPPLLWLPVTLGLSTLTYHTIERPAITPLSTTAAARRFPTLS